jgi:hypothetical protein
VTTADAQTLGFANFSAVIKANGDTVIGLGVQRSTRVSAGVYRIIFTRHVTNCAIVASPHGRLGGQASVRKTANPARVLVYTFSNGGQPRNRAFNIIASCGLS